MSYRDPAQEALRVLAARGTRYASPDSVAAEALRARQVPTPGHGLPNPLEHKPKADLPIFCSLFAQSDGCPYLPQAYLTESPPDPPVVDVCPEATLIAGDGEEHDGSVEGGEDTRSCWFIDPTKWGVVVDYSQPGPFGSDLK